MPTKFKTMKEMCEYLNTGRYNIAPEVFEADFRRWGQGAYQDLPVPRAVNLYICDPNIYFQVTTMFPGVVTVVTPSGQEFLLGETPARIPSEKGVYTFTTYNNERHTIQMRWMKDE